MTTSLANNPAVVNQYISNTILQTPTATLLMGTNSFMQSIPFNSGNQMLNVKFKNLPPALEAIAPSSQGPPSNILQRDIFTTALSLYGAAVYFDTRLIEQDELPWLAAGAERLSYSLRQGQDILYASAINGGSSIYGCRYGTNGDTPTEVTVQDFNDEFAALQENNAPYVSETFPGTLQFSSNALSPCYLVYCNPSQSATFLALQGFTPVGNYPIQNSDRAPGELGFFSRFRVFTSSNILPANERSALGNTEANLYVMGAQPYTGVGLDADNLRTLYRPPQFSNNYGLQVSLGATLFFGASVIQQTWILRTIATGNATFTFGG